MRGNRRSPGIGSGLDTCSPAVDTGCSSVGHVLLGRVECAVRLDLSDEIISEHAGQGRGRHRSVEGGP